MPDLKKKLLVIGLLMIGVSALLITTEFYLRFRNSYPYYDDFRYYYQPDPLAGHDLAEGVPPRYAHAYGQRYLIWSNELGCFDKPYGAEKDYILLAGDSNTWGSVPLEHTYGALLEGCLGRRVLKCGLSAYGTKQEFFKIKKVIEKTGNRPQLVILGYFIENDLTNDFLFPEDVIIDGYMIQKYAIGHCSPAAKRVVVPDKELEEGIRVVESPLPLSFDKKQIKAWLSLHSAFYNSLIRKNPLVRFLGKRYGLANDPLPELYPPVFMSLEKHPWLKGMWQENLDNLKKIKELCDACGAKLLVVLMPGWQQIYITSAVPGYDFDNPNRILGDFFKNEGIAYLDLTPAFRQYYHQRGAGRRVGLYLGPANDSHWSVAGNKFSALLIARKIIDDGLLEVRDKQKAMERINRMQHENIRH